MVSKPFGKSTFAAFALTFFLSSLAFGQGPQQNRIVRPVDNASVVRLQGSLNPRIARATDLGAVSPAMQLNRMMLVLPPSSEQQAALDQLLVEQQDPGSPNYHKWLTPEEFADRFGVAQSDIATLSAWLTSQGFTVDEVARGRNWIAFNGTAAQVEAAFHASIHNYVVSGKAHFAASNDISIPDAFSGVVAGVTGLHDFAPHARSVKAQPRITSSVTGNHFLAPGDFATIYNLPSYTNGVPCTGVTTPCFDGTGQTIGVVGQTDLSTDSNHNNQYDVVTFRNLAGLPTLNLTIKVKGSDPGVVTADVDEANLDVEWAGATAPNAAIIYYVEGPNNSNNGSTGAFAALMDAVNDDKAQVISISYGVCETQAGQSDLTNLTNAGSQANAQGQAIIAPSGDSGAADCDTTQPATNGLAVDFPGSLPTSTSMGGTTFTGDATNSSSPATATQYWSGSTNDTSASALAYIPETSWNDTSGTTISSTGGGVSTLFPKPSWQTGTGVPQDGQRDVPDISFSASPSHDGYLICSQSSCVNGYRNGPTATGSFDVIGGTSAPTPSFAGVAALINQKLGSAQGNVNPQLYTQAASAPWAFHDVTTGNNTVTCQSGSTGCPSGLSYGYNATVGYDLVTGLGSPDVGTLINAMAGVADFSVTPSATSVTIPSNGSTTLTLNVLGTSGSNITFPCTQVSPLTSVTCTAPAVTAGGSAVVSSTLTVATTSANSESGTVNVTATNSSGVSHLVPIAVTVNGTNPDFSITSASSALVFSSGQSGTDSITITPTSGFTSDVALTCAVSSTLGTTTCSLSPATVTGGSGSSTLTINAATLTGKLRGAPLPFSHRGIEGLSTFAFALGMVLTMKPGRSRRSKRAGRNALLGFLLLGVMVFLVSCGGGNSSGGGGGGTTPLSGTVTVTGTSGSLTHSVSIPVSIQ
jgi:subtilase family serine protease